MTVTFNSRETSSRSARRPARQYDAPAAKAVESEVATTYVNATSFAEFGLPEPLIKALNEAGMTSPFPIQSATIPDALAGRDVLGRAQTGSGKTLAFGLALLTRLYGRESRPKRPRALVLVPTRELAMQVADALAPLAKSLDLWCRVAVGGMAFGRQAEALQRGVDLLIATPGRLSDHVRQGTAILSEIEFVALDEADQMADMGFMPQVKEILDLTPQNGQRLLFSATLDGDVDRLVRKYLSNPVTHSVAPSTASVTTMDHHVFQVTQQDKAAIATEIGARDGRTIMFVRTKHHVDRLAEKMRASGVNAAALHGGKTQGQRNKVLADFKEGHLPVLVATDVAARGIHVDDISLVLHVDPAADHKDYLHRAGRTARAGASGTVVTLVTNDQRRTVRRMTDRAGVEAASINIRPGDSELSRITGAREPSGEPVLERRREAPPRRGGSRGGDREFGGGGRRGGSGGYQGRGGSSAGYQGGGGARRESGGYQGRSSEGGGGYQGRSEGSSYGRGQASGGSTGGYQGRSSEGRSSEGRGNEGRGYQGGGARRESGGYQGRSEGGNGGYQGRSDRGGAARRPRD